MGLPLSIQQLGNSLSRKAQHDRRSEVVHHLPGRLFPQGHDTSSVLHHSQKKVTSPCRLFRKERTNNFIFHQSTPHIDLQ